jgi:hypothetical protein
VIVVECTFSDPAPANITGEASADGAVRLATNAKVAAERKA